MFVLKSQLPLSTRQEIDRIEAIPVGLRNSKETAFLVSMAPYLTNRVEKYDADGNILICAGVTVPSGEAGFAKGCIFIKEDASTGTKSLYENVGTTASCSFNLPGDVSTSEIGDEQVTAAKLAGTLDLTGKTIRFSVKSGTPVNAVAATRVLTVGGLPADNDTVTIGSKTYTFQSAIGSGSKAAGTLTVADVPHDGGIVTIGTKSYTFKTALTEAKATSTLTLTGNATDGNSVTIGTTKYTFKETLGAAYDVKIGASASDTIDNLIAAINKAAGEGSTYGTGTVAHPDVTAAAGAGDTMVITAKSVGVAGNAIATTELSDVASWTDAVMAGGVDAVANEILIGASAEASIDNLVAAVNGAAGAGTTYGTGTVAHTSVDAAKATAATMTATAKSNGDAGNSIVSTVGGTSTHLSWGGAVLAGGEGAQAANDVLIGVSAEACIDNLVAAINKGAGEGTTYGNGTVAHTDVTAAKTTAATMTITAKVKGEAANSIATTESGSNTSWAGATMTGGVNGTVGAALEILADSSYLYIASAANTVADTNWRRVSLGSAY